MSASVLHLKQKRMDENRRIANRNMKRLGIDEVVMAFCHFDRFGGCPGVWDEIEDAYADMIDLKLLIAGLDRRWGRALLLRMAGYSSTEIGSYYQVSPSTVRWWFGRIRGIAGGLGIST